MKINFIVPGTELNMYKKVGRFRLPQIGALYLATLLAKEGHQVKVYDENITSFTSQGKLEKKVLEAEGFGLSLLTSTAYRGYDFGQQIREAKPQAIIVYGGPHASALPEEPFQLGKADYVVKREGEEVIKEIFDLEYPPGIIEGGLVEVNNLPFPDFSLLEDNQKITHYPFVASRGCPYCCEFCQVPILLKRKYRPRDPENIFEELKERYKAGQRVVFFNDDLFGLRKKETANFLEKLLQKKIKFKKWSGETRANMINKWEPELLELMRKTGGNWFHIGVESATQEGLEDYHKKQTLDDVARAVEKAHQHKIKINGMFILGSPADDKKIAEYTCQYIKEIGLDTATSSLLYPIPSTKIASQLEEEGKILTKYWPFYDGTHVVIKPERLSPLQLQEAWFNFWKKLYGSKIIYWHFLKKYFKKWKKKNQEYLKALKEGPDFKFTLPLLSRLKKIRENESQRNLPG